MYEYELNLITHALRTDDERLINTTTVCTHIDTILRNKKHKNLRVPKVKVTEVTWPTLQANVLACIQAYQTAPNKYTYTVMAQHLCTLQYLLNTKAA